MVVVWSCKRHKYLQLDEGPAHTDVDNTASSLLHPFCLSFSIFRVSSFSFFSWQKRIKKVWKMSRLLHQVGGCLLESEVISNVVGRREGGFTSCATSSSESPCRHIRINCCGTALGPFWYTPLFVSMAAAKAEATTAAAAASYIALDSTHNCYLNPTPP